MLTGRHDFCVLVASGLFSPEVRGGHYYEFLVRMCRLVLEILTLFHTKRCHFLHQLDLASKISTRFQTYCSFWKMYLVCKPLVIKLRLQILTLAFSLFKMPKNCQINKKIGRQTSTWWPRQTENWSIRTYRPTAFTNRPKNFSWSASRCSKSANPRNLSLKSTIRALFYFALFWRSLVNRCSHFRMVISYRHFFSLSSHLVAG